ncbi:MAG: nucleotide sugar dehydrogenase [Actinobacteria bacterium]|nr:nucleotide sugar dehydrogenase [Actinomycetota bacterium]
MNVTLIGLGYIGLTLAVVLSEQGHSVLGLEVNEEIIDKLKNFKSHVREPGIEEQLKNLVGKNFLVTNNPLEAKKYSDAFIFCLPTPLNNGIPDLTYFVRAINSVLPFAKKNTLFIVRSTVPVGTTRTLLIPLIKSHKIFSNIQPKVAVCPERTAEGKAILELQTLPQLVGIESNDILDSLKELFSFVPEIITISSLEAAEASKLFCNVYRDVQFALANEFARLAEEWGFNIYDAIKAINKNYPRANVALPGLGVGGPCLSKDTYLMASAAKLNNPILSLTARKLNEELVKSELLRVMGLIKGKKALVCGLAFKGEPETNDTRNSPGVEVVKFLLNNNFIVYGFDPAVSENNLSKLGVIPALISEVIGEVDLVVISNNNKFFRTEEFRNTLLRTQKECITLDGWNMITDLKEGLVVKLGSPFDRWAL